MVGYKIQIKPGARSGWVGVVGVVGGFMVERQERWRDVINTVIRILTRSDVSGMVGWMVGSV